MSLRASWLAWSLCAIPLVLTALSLLLLVLNLSHPNTHIYAPWLDNTLTAISYAPVGALIASRHPANPVGWLLCLFGLVISISHFGAEYAIYARLAQPNSLPAGEAMAWIVSWMLSVINGVTVFLLLLFPTGRLPGRRWRWLAWLTVAFVVVGVISSAFASEALLGVLGPIRNPLGIEGFSGVYKVVLYIAFPLLSVAAAFMLFVRLRRSRGVECQQVKWFAYAAAANITGIILAYVIPGVMDTPLWFEWLGFAFNIATVPAIPVAIGIAILRYRLYEIDLLINRTLVYGSLTVMLALVYFGSVVSLQYVFRALTGGNSQLVIVAATLAIAALFNPLRRRVQRFVDRLFYRKKYDVGRVLAEFGARLKDEVDLDTLGGELESVVRETLQPAHASLWLRQPDREAKR